MTRIALCGNIRFESGTIVEALEAALRGQGETEYEINEFETPVELVESATAALSSTPYDMVISSVDLKGLSGIHVVSELAELHSFADDVRMILCSDGADLAYSAQQSGAVGFLIEPVSQADFDRVVGRQLTEIAARNAQSVVVRCRDRVRRIFFDRVSFVETSGHDQLLHHIGVVDTCSVRGSSRDFFALLESDARFFKAGSSYIVNLDHVDTFDSRLGMVTLTDGARIPVPVRSRKQLEQALLDRGHVAV